MPYNQGFFNDQPDVLSSFLQSLLPPPVVNISKIDEDFANVSGAVGIASGVVVSTAMSGVMSHAGLIGLGLLITPLMNLSHAMEFILSQHPNMFYVSQFFLSASIGMLSGFIGLAVVSMFTAALGNPFTMPAIIAAGVSASIVLGVGLFVCNQFKTTEGMKGFLNDLFNPVTTFFTGDFNDRFKDIKPLDEEFSYEEMGIPLMKAS